MFLFLEEVSFVWTHFLPKKQSKFAGAPSPLTYFAFSHYGTFHRGFYNSHCQKLPCSFCILFCVVWDPCSVTYNKKQNYG